MPANASVRVLTYNLKSLTLDAGAARRVIALADPDVVLVQESTRWLRGPARMAAFAASLGMVAVVNSFAARGSAILLRRSLVPRVRRASGVAIESRWVRLRSGWPTPRGYAVLHLAAPTPDAPGLTFFSLHMSALEGQRQRHLPTIAAAVAALGAENLIVGGDLNENPGGPSWLGLTPPLRDASPELTVPTFPASGPRSRLDAFLIGSHVRVADVQVLSGPEVEVGSDHRPVVATFWHAT